jgi:hypothetical protein
MLKWRFPGAKLRCFCELYQAQSVQGQARLRRCVLALQSVLEIIPLWNKSDREHLIVGSDQRFTLHFKKRWVQPS